MRKNKIVLSMITVLFASVSFSAIAFAHDESKRMPAEEVKTDTHSSNQKQDSMNKTDEPSNKKEEKKAQ